MNAVPQSTTPLLSVLEEALAVLKGAAATGRNVEIDLKGLSIKCPAPAFPFSLRDSQALFDRVECQEEALRRWRKEMPASWYGNANIDESLALLGALKAKLLGTSDGEAAALRQDIWLVFSQVLRCLDESGDAVLCARIRALQKRLGSAPVSALEVPDANAAQQGLLARAVEVVHHDACCPALGGNGDADCQCDAVPFLRDLEAALASAPVAPVSEAGVLYANKAEADFARKHGGGHLFVTVGPSGDGEDEPLYAHPPKAAPVSEAGVRDKLYDERMRYHGGSPETARFTEEVPPSTPDKPGRHRFGTSPAAPVSEPLCEYFRDVEEVRTYMHDLALAVHALTGDESEDDPLTVLQRHNHNGLSTSQPAPKDELRRLREALAEIAAVTGFAPEDLDVTVDGLRRLRASPEAAESLEAPQRANEPWRLGCCRLNPRLRGIV